MRNCEICKHKSSVLGYVKKDGRLVHGQFWTCGLDDSEGCPKERLA